MTTLLNWKYSPQQIAGTLLRVYPEHPEHPKLHVSDETVYSAITPTPRGELRRELIACLRQGHAKRLAAALAGHRLAVAGRSPKLAVAVLVERMSRAVLLAKMPGSTAASALHALTIKLQSLVAPMRQTLTYDQGREMSRHAGLTAATGVRVYFCAPHSPW